MNKICPARAAYIDYPPPGTAPAVIPKAQAVLSSSASWQKLTPDNAIVQIIKSMLWQTLSTVGGGTCPRGSLGPFTHIAGRVRGAYPVSAGLPGLEPKLPDGALPPPGKYVSIDHTH